MSFSTSSGFTPVIRSLRDLLGTEYVEAVCAARTFLDGGDASATREAADERVDFLPEALQTRLERLLDRVGSSVIDPPLRHSPDGAGSAAFRAATQCASAPLSALAYYRIGEDGRLYLTTKSEHYHAPLGHGFPGYRLLDRARRLGIPNATHNNTRGAITRGLEMELIRIANGLESDDRGGLDAVLQRTGDLQTLNRVLNLETGSLAVEAALKMILARFYRMQPEMPQPVHHGRIPVILVMGNDDGQLSANYHGTTILTQALRGMWPVPHDVMEKARFWNIVAIRPDCTADLDRIFDRFERPPYKIAGFFHEIIMMNYGGRRLNPDFLGQVYDRCHRHDVPTVADEIQSCLWAPGLFLFREYGLKPTFVAIGKGFPGGDYPASRILFSAAMDVMPQFGALVTNGQEELASLAYRVTMAWACANTAQTAALGEFFATGLREVARDFPESIEGVDGWRHLSTLRFRDLARAQAFVRALSIRGLDVSAQTYKADCPPVVLFKLPLIMREPAISFVLETMRRVLRGN